MGLSLLGSTFISRLHSHCYHNFYVYVGARHAAAVYGGDYCDGDGDGDGDGDERVVVNGRVYCGDACYGDACRYGDGCRNGHLLTI